MIEEIERLASIDSGSYDVAGVDAVARRVRRAVRGAGVRGHAHRPRADGAPASWGRGPTLLLLGHADTVWAEGWPVTRDGDWLRGPGVGDMKGCVVMAAHALGVALAHGPERLGAVEVLIVPDEELGSPASRAWIEERARAARRVPRARGGLARRGRRRRARCGGRDVRHGARAHGARRGARGRGRERRLGPGAARRRAGGRDGRRARRRASACSAAGRRGRSSRARPRSTSTCARPTPRPRRVARTDPTPLVDRGSAARASSSRCAEASRGRRSRRSGRAGCGRSRRRAATSWASR